MAYTVPQVLVFQEFNLLPAEITEPLRAHIAGPHAELFRYAEADEKAQIGLGAYDAEADQTYAWPGRPAGSVVDQTYVKVFMDDAKLVLFEDLLSGDETVAPVAGSTNKIRRTGDDGFAENGEYDRIAELFDRDVRAGDRVYIRGVVDGDVHELTSYVLDVEGDAIEATVGDALESDDNADDQSEDTEVTQTAGTENDVVLAADMSTYQGLTDGYINEVYTVTVIAGSAGGDYTTALIKVTSASGLDTEASIAPDESGQLFEVGGRQLQLSFTGTDDLVAGQKWRVVVAAEFERAQAVSGGTYTGTRDTTYVITVVRGGEFAAADPDDRPLITVRTIHGIDASNGPIRVDGASEDVPIGTKSVTAQFYGTGALSSSSDGELTTRDPVIGLRKDDVYYIDVTAAAEGRMSTLVLGHNLPTALLDATDLDLQVYLLQDIEITQDREGFDPLVNWETSATELTIISGIVAYEDTWTDAGEPIPIVIASGTLYAQYRAWLSDLCGEVNEVADVADLDDAISGELSPDNPLKYGVFKALSNSNGTAVKFTAVCEPDDTDSWLEVLEQLVGRDDVYGLVPLTRNQTVLDAWAAHVDSQSSAENGRWRTAWFNLPVNTALAVVDAASSTDEDEVLATLTDDPDTSGSQFTLLTVTSGNVDFVDAGVAPGDVVRFLFGESFDEQTYESFVVDAVLNAETLRLVSGHEFAVTTAEKVEIWHPLSKTEMAVDVGTTAGTYGNRRVRAVWPDEVGSGGVTFPGYHLCAALAGLRSGVVPHQPLTNLEIAGFDDLSRTVDLFNGSQLNAMAERGAWIVTQDRSGNVVTRHALTTDTTDTNTREEMVVANVDSMSFVFRRRIEPYIGKSNVTPSLLSALRVELDAAITFLLSSGFTDRLGGQLIGGEITQLRVHAVLKDRVVAVIELQIPYPLNNVELYLVI